MPGGVEIGAEARGLLGSPSSGTATSARLAGREPQRGGGVVREPVVARPLVGERHPQAGDRHAAERRGGVEDRPDLHAAEAEPGVGADDAGAHRDDRGVGVRDVARDRERASRPTPPRSRRRTRGRT